MAETRVLVTCDDMGYHQAINRAIVQVLGCGLVKSVSVMPTGPHFEDAVSRLRGAGIREVGVHLALAAEYPNLPMRPVTDPERVPTLVDERGYFPADVSAVLDRASLSEVREEVRAQIRRIRAAGFTVSHVDGHMFWYESGEAMHDAVAEICAGEKLPLRSATDHRYRQIETVRMYWDGFVGIDARLADYRGFFADARAGLSELIIHPGLDPGALATFTRAGARRIADYLFFSDPELHRRLSDLGVEIVGWGDLAA